MDNSELGGSPSALKMYCSKFNPKPLKSTVKPVENKNGHSKIDKTKILMTNGSLMKVESMAEWSILQYF